MEYDTDVLRYTDKTFEGTMIQFKRHIQYGLLNYLGVPSDDDMEWKIHDLISRLWAMMSNIERKSLIFTFDLLMRNCSSPCMRTLCILATSNDGKQAYIETNIKLKQKML